MTGARDLGPPPAAAPCDPLLTPRPPADALTRRGLLGSAGVLIASSTVAVQAAGAAPPDGRVDAVPTGVTRTWLSPEYWANRLADWRLHAGRFECLSTGLGACTVGVLPRSLEGGDLPAVLEVRTGTLQAGSGFSGFLVGTGGGALHWKAAATVGSASGQGGGLFAVYDGDGAVRFREHTDEQDQFAYAVLSSGERSGPAPARTSREDVTLRLTSTPAGAGRCDLELSARVTSTGAVLSRTVRRGVAGSALVGGVSLVSARTGSSGARHWLRGLRTEGPGVAVHDRRAGPVLGTLHTLSGSVLKLTAQLMPIGRTEPQRVVLQVRPPGTTTWRTVQTAAVEDGFCARFRIADWDGTRPHAYRVGWAVGTPQQAYWQGVVRADPVAQRTLRVAMLNCTIHQFRNSDAATSGVPRLPGEVPRGLYTDRNVYFPYAELVASVRAARPDLLVALGDQYYESHPTRRDDTDLLLDVLGKYYLWVWSFAEITRDRPTVCLVDDHDVFQGNLWGWSGRPAPDGRQDAGGYVFPATWVNTVQRVQCGHDPDPYDATPVQQGISVYYAAFSYGGVSFALLEDRKFKNTNQDGTDAGAPLEEPRDLLGPRQEAFLQAWAALHPGQPKVALTQTAYACIQTAPDGTPQRDMDSGGSAVTGRRTALRLLREARALLLSGDQHLASLVRHGLEGPADGPVQFSAPAAGSGFQRWFEPGPLPNASGPHTGDFTDAFGNRFRVLAVANPRVSAAAVAAALRGPNVGDRDLKREGYGIVEIDKTARVHRLHCWPWRNGPAALGPGEYAGWPYELPFDEV
jgi:alkaline phosphatase D